MASNVEDSSPPKGYSYSRRKLYFSFFVGAYLYVGVGIFMAWPSPALVLLESRNLTSLQSSLLVSIGGLAPGPLITTFGINTIGRKYTLLTIWSTLMICWIITFISTNIYSLLVARLIGGCGMGAAFSAIGVYTSEISDVLVRGPLNSASVVLFTVGNIIVNSTGPFVNLTVLNIISAVFTFIFAIFFWFIPESPHYQVNKGQNEKALSTLTWLRHNADKKDIEDELHQIQYYIEEEKRDVIGFKKLFSSKVVLKQFVVAWYMLIIQQLTGVGAVLAFALTIFESANLSFRAAYVPIALNVFSIFAGFPTPFLVKKFGNKILFIISTVGCAIGHGILAAYFLILERGYDISSLSWLPIFGTFVLLLFVNIGLLNLVWAVISDLFPNSVKGYAVGICGIFSTFLGFVLNTIFGLCKDAFNYGPTFLGYSLALLIGTVGFFFIPDLTHMTLQEIQEYFEGKSKPPKEEIRNLSLKQN